MEKKKYSVIVGSGSYIPTRKIFNSDFLKHQFFGPDGLKLEKEDEEIIKQFQQITGIDERRYVTDDLVSSDIAYLAAKEALDSSGIDPETLDYIIVAHNFGDISVENYHSEFVPSLAARVKNRLKINNPDAVGYDIIFGCAGWLQAMIQGDYYIRTGTAKRVLVIGAETLSRIADPHDRDSMIYSDGAGAVILEAVESEKPVGILSHTTQSFSVELANVLRMGKSNNPAYKGTNLFLKMEGRVLYEHALKIVPKVIKKSIDAAGVSIGSIDKLLIHQANNKMDEAILKRLFAEYNIKEIPDNIMPMTISWLGNSSVATLPTLYDLLTKCKMGEQLITGGRNIVFASVGAGVNVNSVVYKVPE
jgi:3-oxoacyl-[acyl-carrier-protein] synthase-3